MLACEKKSSNRCTSRVFHLSLQTGSLTISLRQYEREILEDRMVGKLECQGDRGFSCLHVWSKITLTIVIYFYRTFESTKGAFIWFPWVLRCRNLSPMYENAPKRTVGRWHRLSWALSVSHVISNRSRPIANLFSSLVCLHWIFDYLNSFKWNDDLSKLWNPFRILPPTATPVAAVLRRMWRHGMWLCSESF